MVDNFALLVSQLMMIVVLWRCFTLPEPDGNDEPRKRNYGPRARSLPKKRDPRNG